jgi:single-strand DNA-binding protein
MIGRLTKDPELRYLPNGTPKAELRLATSREWKDRNGEQQKDVCYIDIVVWSRQAEIVKQYLSKGRQIFVEGRLDFQEWERDGQRRSKHQIVADRVQFLDRASESQNGDYAPNYGGSSYEGGRRGEGGYAPYRGKTYGGKTYGGNAYQEGPPPESAPQGAPMNEAMGVPESDLPF